MASVSKEVQVKEGNRYWRLYKRLGNAKAVADYVGCSKSTVCARINLAGHVFPSNEDRQRKNNFSEKKLRFYLSQYRKGVSLSQLSLIYSVGPITLTKIFKQRGWFISRSEWRSRFMVGDLAPGTIGARRKLENDGARMCGMDGFRQTVAYISGRIAREYSILRKTLSLDHRYSVHAAFYNVEDLKRPVSVQELCHPVNLRAIPMCDNSSKRAKCSFPAKELRKRINAWNKKNGNPFKQEPYRSYDFERWNS